VTGALDSGVTGALDSGVRGGFYCVGVFVSGALDNGVVAYGVVFTYWFGDLGGTFADYGEGVLDGLVSDLGKGESTLSLFLLIGDELVLSTGGSDLPDAENIGVSFTGSLEDWGVLNWLGILVYGETSLLGG
jgi:hypothetical protein